MKEVDFDSLCELISERLGLEVRGRDRKKVQATVATRCQDRKLDGPEQYAGLLRGTGRDAAEEWQRLASLLTTGETFFFRNKGHFRMLRERVLPELIGLRRADRSLRLWSAGCASGEEPYSLAMLLQEVLPEIDRWQVFMLGTDIDAEALDKARRGVYSEWSFRNVDPRTRDRYFRPHGDDWGIDER
ncbi:MAG: chemotaxis protein CheR, partial [Planctomycetota bacterium]|nr:chemotaxis protein CheR [Planctomycetota bacterium]